MASIEYVEFRLHVSFPDLSVGKTITDKTILSMQQSV